jgi:CRISPR-associated endonuclease/helicase Cas3
MEPSPWGEGTYIVGFAQERGALMTLKLERIQRARLTEQPYDLPQDYDRSVLHNHAWGVWLGEGEPVRVVLRFSRHVTRRVRESRWHPTEKLKDLPSGELEWTAEVSEPQEMLPWIRGWGADVEVMAPANLRAALVAEVERWMRVYQMSQGLDEYGLPK